MTYLKAWEVESGMRSIISALARECKVARSTVLTIHGELMFFGKIAPAQMIDGKYVPRDLGSILLTGVNIFMLLIFFIVRQAKCYRGTRSDCLRRLASLFSQ